MYKQRYLNQMEGRLAVIISRSVRREMAEVLNEYLSQASSQAFLPPEPMTWPQWLLETEPYQFALGEIPMQMPPQQIIALPVLDDLSQPSEQMREILDDLLVYQTAYFNLTDKDKRIAQSRKLRPYPSLEQVRAAILAMPAQTDIQKRDRAVMALAILSGARDSAIISLKLKHLDTHHGLVTQYPDEVKTKRSKTIITGFFPVGEIIESILLEWVDYLTKEMLFGPDDPLFPKTDVKPDATSGFRANGLSREHWNTTTPICKIFRQAFEGAGLPYFNPHSLRHTLGHLAQTYCKTPEDFKAWSQNIGHESVLTTFGSYGYIDPRKQCEIIKGLGKKEQEEDVLSILRRLEAKL